MSPQFPTAGIRTKLYGPIDQVAAEHKPITITVKRGNPVLVAEQDWESIQETLYLLPVPGMRDSLREGLPQCESL